MEPQRKEFLNINEASELLGIARGTLYKKVMAREVPHYKTGKFLRFERNELIAWIEERKVEVER